MKPGPTEVSTPPLRCRRARSGGAAQNHTIEAPRPHRRSRAGAFTLVELMVVVAIMGVVMTIAIPSLYRHLHPESMQKAVTDFMEACNQARAHAILQGTPTELVVRADTGSITVRPAAGAPAKAEEMSDAPMELVRRRNQGVEYTEFRRSGSSGGSGAAGGFSASLSDKIAVEALEVNFMDLMEAEEARVRFYPNGTCDEFKLVLFRPDTGERRLLTLEVVTGLADVESDPSKFLNYR